MTQPRPEPLPDWFAELLAEDDAPASAPQPKPSTAQPAAPLDPARLSVGELEVILAERKRNERLQRMREVRSIVGGTAPLTEPKPNPPAQPHSTPRQPENPIFFPDPPVATQEKPRSLPQAESTVAVYVPPAILETVVQAEANPPIGEDDTLSTRFRSPALVPPALAAPQPEKKSSTAINKIMVGLEILVIVLCLGVVGYYGLNALGFPVDNLFNSTQPSGLSAHGDGRDVSVVGGRPLAIIAPESAATVIASQPSPTATIDSGPISAPILNLTPDTSPTANSDVPTPAGVTTTPGGPATAPPGTATLSVAASPTRGQVSAPTATKPAAPARPAATPVSTPVIVAPAPLQTVGPTNTLDLPAKRLVIPKINVDVAIKEVFIDINRWQVADYAAGHHRGTANPGETGNMVVAGHRDIRGSVFMRLPELTPGDIIYYYTDAGRYTYTVTDTFIVYPNDISVMDYTDDPTTTLITCTPVALATKRFIVRGRLTETPSGKL